MANKSTNLSRHFIDAVGDDSKEPVCVLMGDDKAHFLVKEMGLNDMRRVKNNFLKVMFFRKVHDSLNQFAPNSQALARRTDGHTEQRSFLERQEERGGGEE